MSTISRPLVVSPGAFPIGFTVVMIASTARVARTALFGNNATFEALGWSPARFAWALRKPGRLSTSIPWCWTASSAKLGPGRSPFAPRPTERRGRGMGARPVGSVHGSLRLERPLRPSVFRVLADMSRDRRRVGGAM